MKFPYKNILTGIPATLFCMQTFGAETQNDHANTLNDLAEKGKKQKLETGNTTKPNIIFIYADDLGYGDIGSYGQEKIHTPHLDRLAEEGMLFTDAYAGHTVSAPSRSALLTGIHTGRNLFRGNARIPLRETDYTVADLLAEQGYVNGIFGKWGLGEPGTTGVPLLQGFHEFYGFLNQRRAHRYCVEHVWQNEELVLLPGNMGNWCNDHTAEWYQNKLKDFIREHREQPFFAYYATQIPHSELRTTEADLQSYLDSDGRSIFDEELHDRELMEKYPVYSNLKSWIERHHMRGGRTSRPLATYAGMVTQLDRHVGEIVALLDELGLSENTLLIFTSDNGPASGGGADPDFFNSSGGLRGIKRDLYEGGIRVPMIAKWPGKIEAGSISNYLWAAWDLMPTAAELSGAESKVPEGIDGVSAVPVFMGEEMERPNALYWESTDGRHRADGDLGIAVRKGKWKAITNFSLRDDLELYNLEEDPGETQNLASQYPEKIREFKELIKNTRTPSEHWPLDKELWNDFINRAP